MGFNVPMLISTKIWSFKQLRLEILCLVSQQVKVNNIIYCLRKLPIQHGDVSLMLGNHKSQFLNVNHYNRKYVYQVSLYSSILNDFINAKLSNFRDFDEKAILFYCI